MTYLFSSAVVSTIGYLISPRDFVPPPNRGSNSSHQTFANHSHPMKKVRLYSIRLTYPREVRHQGTPPNLSRLRVLLLCVFRALLVSSSSSLVLYMYAPNLEGSFRTAVRAGAGMGPWARGEGRANRRIPLRRVGDGYSFLLAAVTHIGERDRHC